MTLIRTSPSGPELDVGGGETSDDIENVSSVPGATVTDALDQLQSGGGAVGNSNGYLSRNVYVNAADPDVGTLNNEGNLCQAATTWTTPDQIPAGNLFEVVCWASGASGANGAQVTAAEAAVGRASGPGGGARISRWFSRRDLINALPIVMTIPLAVSPPARPTAAHTTQTSNAGNPCFFGSLVTAFGGGAARTTDATAASGGSGGGSRGPGAVGVGTSQTTGGLPASTGGSIGVGEAGSGCATAPAPGQLAVGGGGAAGAGSSATSNNPGQNGGAADTGGGGGGSPGNWATPGPAGASGEGGRSGVSTTGTLQNGGGGAAGAVPGGRGGDGADGTHENSGSGGGAGGTAGTVAETPGGDGGNGGKPGGAGGSGGHGRGANGTPWGGLGGIGARGQITVTAYA